MKKILKSPWTISIVTMIISFLLTVIYDLIKGKEIFSTIGRFFLAVWKVVIAFLFFDIKVWWIIVGIAFIVLMLYLVSRRLDKKNTQKPDFTSYKMDRFNKWKWSWSWKYINYSKQWEISDLIAHCPKCNTPMQHDVYEEYFKCPRCKFQPPYDDFEKSYEVSAVIIDNVNQQKYFNEHSL
ncbi:MAG: hypothetical protein WBI07_07070 [Mobilitalea sp.]